MIIIGNGFFDNFFEVKHSSVDIVVNSLCIINGSYDFHTLSEP